jgi:hypothetical protein
MEKSGRKKENHIGTAEIKKDTHCFPAGQTLWGIPARTYFVIPGDPPAITRNHQKPKSYFIISAKSTWALKLWAGSGKVPFRTSPA